MADGRRRKKAAVGQSEANGHANQNAKNVPPACKETGPPSRPQRAAATEAARLAHMKGPDGDYAALAALLKNPSLQKVIAAAQAEEAAQDASKKRKRPPPTRPLFGTGSAYAEKGGMDSEDEDNPADNKEPGDGDGSASESEPEYDPDKGAESDDEKSASDEEEENEKEEEAEAIAELGELNENQPKTSEEVDLEALLAAAPGKHVVKKKKVAKKAKVVTEKSLPRKGGQTAAAKVVLNGAITPTGPALDGGNLLLTSHLRLQQEQAHQAAKTDKMENILSQLLQYMKRGSKTGAQLSPVSEATLTSASQQDGTTEGSRVEEQGLLHKLKRNPGLLTANESTHKLLASDAVNLCLLVSGLPDTELMMANTRLAFRVKAEDDEQLELFEDLYYDFILKKQAANFRLKRGKIVTTIRKAGEEVYCLPTAGTEAWSKKTSALLADASYRKVGADEYGNIDFRQVLSKSYRHLNSNELNTDCLSVTTAQLALVEVVLELQLRGVMRLDKKELPMLAHREEALSESPRHSQYVSIIRHEDPLVCPQKLRSRAEARSSALRIENGKAQGATPLADKELSENARPNSPAVGGQE